MRIYILSFLLALAHLTTAQPGSLKGCTSEEYKKSERLISLALKFREAKEITKALKNLDDAERKCPSNSNVYKLRGLLFHQLQDYSSAISQFEKSLALKPHQSDVLFHIGMSEYRMKKYREALHNFSEAINLNTDNIADCRYMRAVCYYWINEYKNAIDDLNPNILKEKALPFLELRAKCYTELKRYHEAIKDYKSIIALGDKGQYKTYLSIAQVYCYAGDNDLLHQRMTTYGDSVIAYLSEFKTLDHGNSDTSLLTGLAYMLKGDSIHANANFRALCSKDSLDANAYSSWGHSELYFRNYQNVIRILERAIRVCKGKVNLDTYYNLGVAELSMCNFEIAIKYFEEGVEADSLNFEFHRGIVGALLPRISASHIVKEGIDFLLGVDTIDLKEKELYFIAKVAIDIRERNYSSAIRILDDAPLINMEDDGLRYAVRGYLNEMMGQGKEAEINYNEAIRSDPENWYFSALLVSHYLKIGNYSQASEKMKRVAELNSKLCGEIDEYLRDKKVIPVIFVNVRLLVEYSIADVFTSGKLLDTFDCPPE
ncbi:MAG TPA: CDC27 family protein [Cyclobacteriaceae bacterium]|jgi:tetratricopeptide (TPR) repeat protein|nr:CDC27 family protein [Cyclobacteriaceae bacterium]